MQLEEVDGGKRVERQEIETEIETEMGVFFEIMLDTGDSHRRSSSMKKASWRQVLALGYMYVYLTS